MSLLGSSGMAKSLGNSGAFNGGMGDFKGNGPLKAYGNTQGSMGELMGMSSKGNGGASSGYNGKRRTMAESLSSLDDSNGAGSGLAHYQDVSLLGSKPYDMGSMISELNQLSGAAQQLQQQPQQQAAQPLINLQDPRVQQILGMFLGG